jgi:hypothetical protein
MNVLILGLPALVLSLTFTFLVTFNPNGNLHELSRRGNQSGAFPQATAISERDPESAFGLTESKSGLAGFGRLPRSRPVVCARLHRDVCQVGFRREPSRLISRESNLTVNDDVELPSASGLDVHRTTSSRLKPGLRTEGFGFVVSGGAVKDQDRLISYLSLFGRLLHRTSALERF